MSRFRHSDHARWLIRLTALGVALAMCFPLSVWSWWDVLPALSPFTAALSALARREVNLALTVLAVPLALLAFFRGRWFCYRMCPTGTLADLVATGRAPARGPVMRGLVGGRWLVMAALSGSVMGWPLVLWMDPLAMLGGAVGAMKTGAISWSHLWGILPLAMVLVASRVWPRVWCDRLCPLGAMQQGLGRVGWSVRRCWRTDLRPRPSAAEACAIPQASSPWLTRREVLATGAGLAAGYILRRHSAGEPEDPLIRPPGAGDGSRLKRLCARCGRCFQVCPRHVLRPDLGQSGWAGLLTPRVVIGDDYCGEWCHACSRVCPTGAIAPLTLEEKRRVMIGLAVVDRATCLAWDDGQACMVCQEFCPYRAIREVVHNDVNCPVVIQTLCRGCGACQTACPANPAPAIRVRGLARQTLAPVGEADGETYFSHLPFTK